MASMSFGTLMLVISSLLVSSSIFQMFTIEPSQCVTRHQYSYFYCAVPFLEVAAANTDMEAMRDRFLYWCATTG